MDSLHVKDDDVSIHLFKPMSDGAGQTCRLAEKKMFSELTRLYEIHSYVEVKM